jgi:hypothetical protein
MISKSHIPDAPQSNPVHPPIPIVYERQEMVWEYKQVIRNLAKEEAPSEGELNRLGAEGWELAGVFNDSLLAYFYFKRLGREKHDKRERQRK